MADIRSDVRAARARRRRRAVLAGSIVVLASAVLGLGALIASDALRLEGAPGPALADRATTTTEALEQQTPRCGALLTPDDPLVLWIGGDSLAGSLGPSLGEQAADTGVVQPTYDSRVSSGLSSPEFFDWPEHATAELPLLDPDVVVFIIGANDWRTPTSSSGGSSAWEAEYEQQVEEMLGILEDDTPGRHVFWVGSPTMQDRRKDAGAQQVNAVAQRVVDRHERATYVDGYQLFSGEEGKYAASLPGLSGRTVRVRAGDGIHFTDEGGDLLGDHVYDLIDARCRVTGHAIEGAPKPVLRAKGSDGPGGGSGGSGSGSGRSSGTTPPTEPPATIATTPAPAPVPEPDTVPETTPSTEAPTTPTSEGDPGAPSP
jgi:hypothetical protein